MNIDRFAPFYRWVEYAAFGRALERRRFAFLHRLGNAHRVLILGEGDGRTLARLLAVAPAARIDVVELSSAMIHLAKRRTGSSDRIDFRQADALTTCWPNESYDGVVTNFFLDCFHEPEAKLLVHRLAGALVPGGVWIVSEFAIPERGWRRWHALLWTRSMYIFFGVVSSLPVRRLPPLGRLLAEEGLRRLEREEERWGLIYSEVWVKD
jgi:ubiquinone/menaquinone biosynthesis C-methylase UbiE